jgi:thioredoxin reductase (NADPH)
MEPGSATETPDVHGAFPRLTRDQIAALERIGTRRPTREDEVLYREGDRACDLFVILDGLVALVERYGSEEEVIGVHGPGRFLGEIGLLTGQSVLLTAVVREPGEVLAVPADRLRELVAQDATLGDLILRAYLVRRNVLIDLGAGIRIIGSRFSPDTRRLREFAARNRLPHRWVDLEADLRAEALLRALGVAADETPVVVWGEDTVLRNPSNAELARVLGLRVETDADAVWDLLVVGAGPAGLAAAVTGASEGLATVVIEELATGGQAGSSSRIENYLGFPAGISGSELADRAIIQADKFGARITVPGEVTRLEHDHGVHVVTLGSGERLRSRTVVIATGAQYRKLPVSRLEELEGTGVFYAATVAEAPLCDGAPVAVVGGGNSAGQAALFLAAHASRVYLMIRGDDLGKSMSRYLADRLERSDAIGILRNTEVRELLGEGELEAVVLENNRSGAREHLPVRRLFVFIGADPHTDWLGDELALDDHGFVLTGADVARLLPVPTKGEAFRNVASLGTSRPGVFAAGDVRSGSIKRVASAVGEGSMSVRLAYDHLHAAPTVPAYPPGAREPSEDGSRPDRRQANYAPS